MTFTPCKRLSAKAIETIQRRRAQNHSWDAIAPALGWSPDGLRRRFDEAFRRRSNERAYKSRHGFEQDHVDGCGFVAKHVPPPPEALAEALARANAPRSLSAWFFGDPPPGYSALDGRGR